MTKPPRIHPKTPPRLAAKFKKAGSYHRLADLLEINVRWVYKLIAHGIEPSDQTEYGRGLRAKLHLPRRKRKRKPPKPQPAHRSWWKKQDRETIIKQLYELNKEKKP